MFKKRVINTDRKIFFYVTFKNFTETLQYQYIERG